MEWVETTGKTIEEARERALDQLGVAADDAEFDIVEEPRAGLFGLIRGEARVRARVRPAEVRPKQERRRRSKASRAEEETGADTPASGPESEEAAEPASAVADAAPSRSRREGGAAPRNGRDRQRRNEAPRSNSRDEDRPEVEVDPADVGAAAVAFMEGLVEAFGLEARVELLIDGAELEVRVHGEELGLLIGPGGRTLNAIQDLARVAAQRRLGDHQTRLRIDVSGYRERRREALERFARSVAEQVVDSGQPRSMEAMPSADRKVIHDVLAEIDGVTSRSEGDDPDRRVVVVPE
jgi:spoIIIJ-associated protein